MNIINFLSFIWMMFTWSLLKMVTLPEDKLISLRTKKKNNDQSYYLLKSIDSFDDNSSMDLILD